MSKEHDDIEDLFAENDEGVFGNDSYDRSDGLDIIGADRRSERTPVDPGQAYDEGEEYLEDGFFEDEEPYYEEDAPSYGGRYGEEDPEKDAEILSRMNKTKKSSPMKPLLLIAVIAAVVVVILLVVKLGGGRTPGGQNTNVQPETEAPVLTEEDEASDIQAIIQTYLNARIHNDMNTLATVVDDVSALPENDSTSAFFESYQNIRVYTTPGINEGEYVAYVRSDVNLTNYDTDLPDLQFFYIRTAEDGTRYIATSQTEAEANYIEQIIRTDEVQGLINEVWGILDGIAESDTDLAALISMLYGTDAGQTQTEASAETQPQETTAADNSSSSDDSGQGTGEGASPADYEMTEVNDTVTINDTVNMRATPSTDAEILVVIPVGTSVSRSHHGANWSYVTYEGYSGFVLSEFVDED